MMGKVKVKVNTLGLIDEHDCYVLPAVARLGIKVRLPVLVEGITVVVMCGLILPNRTLLETIRGFLGI